MRYALQREGGLLMRKKPKEETVPQERQDTIRRQMRTVLEQCPCSAKDLSADIRISEKEVYAHLEHIEKSLSKSSRPLIVTPAVCKKCSFVFSKRDRLKKPGKCPVCRGESIQEPLFSLEPPQ